MPDDFHVAILRNHFIEHDAESPAIVIPVKQVPSVDDRMIPILFSLRTCLKVTMNRVAPGS